MKKALVCFAVGMLAAVGSQGDVLMLEDFEDATVNYTSSDPEFSDGAGDYWIRTDGSNISGVYAGQGGSSFFAGQDLDAANPVGSGGPTTMTLTFSGINIMNYVNLSFSGLFAEDDDGANQDWDVPDGLTVQYQIDGGGFQNLIAFEDQGATNTEPLQDTDFNGVGDGAALTPTFTSYSAGITGTGNSLDLLVTASLDSGDEDFAIDNFQVEGDLVPEPSTMALMGLGLLLAVRRKRNG